MQVAKDSEVRTQEFGFKTRFQETLQWAAGKVSRPVRGKRQPAPKGRHGAIGGLREHIWELSLIALGLVLFGQSAQAIPHGDFLRHSGSGEQRTPASLPFPHADEESDTDDILENYEVYLRYVLVVGRSTNPKLARALAQKYAKLKEYDPKGAARFLKGLRYEMVHRLQISRLSRRQLHSGSRAARVWVGRYLDEWYREADEQLYRHYARAMAERARED